MHVTTILFLFMVCIVQIGLCFSGAPSHDLNGPCVSQHGSLWPFEVSYTSHWSHCKGKAEAKKKVPIVSVGLGLCGNWLGAIELDVTKNYVSLLILWNFEPGKFTSCSGDINVQQILRYGFSLKHSWHPTPVLAFPTEMVYKEQAGCLPTSFSMDHSNNTHCRTAGKSQKLTIILYLKFLKSQSLAESKKKVAFYRAEKFISITNPQKGLIAVVVW